MTKKPKDGTLSTRGSSDKNPKEKDVTTKMRALWQVNKIRVHSHANTRMSQRKILYPEILQALGNAKHEPAKDRYSIEHENWEYSFLGKTIDKRELRIGIAFEVDHKTNERLLIITVIDPNKEDA
ncbi:MAG: DUF4258 domain-containing protein [Pseudobdellovibrionaceae bacterium]